MHGRLTLALPLGLALTAALACHRGGSDPVVAEGSGITVTTKELEARIAEQPPMARQGFEAIDKKKQFLDGYLRFELLAKEAEKQGYLKDPEVQLAIRRLMVSRYYSKFFQDPGAAKRVTDDEVKAYYDGHPEEFHRPARLHVLQILLAAEPGTPARAKRAAEAKALLAKVQAEEVKMPGAFANAARATSDDAASKGVGGDLGMRSEEELAKLAGPEVAAAAAKLKDNETAPEVVESAKGFHLVRLVGRQPAWERTLADASPMIRNRLGSQKRAQEFEEHLKSLRDKASIKIDEKALAEVKVPPAGPGPTPHARP